MQSKQYFTKIKNYPHEKSTEPENPLTQIFQLCFSKREKTLVNQKFTRVYLHLFVPLTVLFSNQFLHDLDLIWELRELIPL